MYYGAGRGGLLKPLCKNSYHLGILMYIRLAIHLCTEIAVKVYMDKVVPRRDEPGVCTYVGEVMLYNLHPTTCKSSSCHLASTQ